MHTGSKRDAITVEHILAHHLLMCDARDISQWVENAFEVYFAAGYLLLSSGYAQSASSGIHSPPTTPSKTGSKSLTAKSHGQPAGGGVASGLSEGTRSDHHL